MDFTSTLISNKNIATDSPSATNTSSVSDSNTVTTTPNAGSIASSTTTTTTTPAIFIPHKSNSTNNNTALSISPTSTLPINNNNSNSSSNSQSNENTHILGNNMDLNKIRRDSIAHSQGMGGVSWGSLTIGSWLRDEVMLRGLNNSNNNNNNNNNSNIMGTMMENSIGPNCSSQSKVYNTNRNSISYRRLSTINKLNKPVKSGNNDNKNGDSHNNHPSDPYSNFPATSSDHSDTLHLNSPPLSSNSTYLPYFETQFCRDYSCCGLSLPGLHDLLRHYEEAHIGGFGYNIGYLNGNHISYNNNNNSNYGVKKQNNYLKQQYSKQQQRNVIQEQLKSKDNDSRFLNKSNANNNNHVIGETIHGDSTSMPKIKNNLDNFSFNNDKNKDVSIRNNQKLTTSTEINTNNRSSSDNSNNNITNNNNNSMMGTGMDMDSMNNDLLSMGFDPSRNHNISRVPDSTTHDPTSNMDSTHGLRNSSIPSSIITNGPLNNGLGVIDADSHHDNEVAIAKEEEREKDGGGDADSDIVMDSNVKSIINNSDDNNNITSSSANNESFHNLKESVNSLDVSTSNSHGFHNILMENSGDLNNLLVDSFSIQQMHFDNNTNIHGINNSNNNNNNNNNNNHDNDILGDIGNNQPFMEDAIHNEASGMAHQDPLSNLHTNNNDDGDIDNDDMNNDGNSMNFIDDPARRLYVMDHEEHKPFKCPVIGCEKTYKNQNGLKYHRLHGHQNQKLLENPDGTFTVLDPDSNEPYPEGMGYEKDKPYRCEVCGKRYKNLNGLKYHRGHSTH